MRTITTACPSCGEVELTNNDINLQVCDTTAMSFYSFTCPRCCQHINKPADDYIISLLLSGGVKANVFEIPAEALEPHSTEALTLDYAIELHADVALL